MVGHSTMQFDEIETAIRSAGLAVRDTVELSPRAAQMAPLPADLMNGPLGRWLAKRHPCGQVWQHQGVALDHICAGRNVVVATGTASGKSRVFQYAALHAALQPGQGRRTLVLYPVKALAADQLIRWRELVDEVGLPAEALTRIDGNVDPQVRAALLGAAKVVLMTPDVCHAWLMKKLHLPEVRHFLDGLQHVVLDEAHVYDGIFGSNTAFMLRRLISAKLALFPHQAPLQFIVTTATIQNPAAQMELLVGQPFELVGEDDDGSASHHRRLYLATSSDLSGKGEAVLSDILMHLAPVAMAHQRRMIAFHDSRQGTERVAMQVSAKGILAYRSGYEEADRERIEDALRRGQILGIVSTSAMELGIDVPSLDIGLNLGIPRTRKQFRQRFGRVGRSAPGAFILLADAQAIKDLRGNLQTYLMQGVEPSHLYLGNRFMQFAQARCMLQEMANSGKPKAFATSSPGVPVWPAGFEQQLANAALPNHQLDAEFHFMASMAGHLPHLNFPLRLLGERNFELLPPGQGKSAPSSGKNRIGNISVGQALREAYPGATYRHQGAYYRVHRWQESEFQPSIIIEKQKGLLSTSPLLEREISFCRDKIIDNRLLMAPGGYVAETELIVVETVKGYDQSMNGAPPKRHVYKPEQRKRREILTTGIVIALDDDVLNEALRNAGVLHAMGETLKACFLDRHDVEPNDIELSIGECALVGPEGPMRIANSIVIYDAAYGGMRLTEKLFDDFMTKIVDNCFDRHMRELFQTHAWRQRVLRPVLKWMRALTTAPITALPAPIWPDHITTFFAPGSIVSMFAAGRFVERQLGAVTTMAIDGRTQLYYEYNVTDAKGVSKKLAPAAALRPRGHQWSVITGSVPNS